MSTLFRAVLTRSVGALLTAAVSFTAFGEASAAPFPVMSGLGVQAAQSALITDVRYRGKRRYVRHSRRGYVGLGVLGLGAAAIIAGTRPRYYQEDVYPAYRPAYRPAPVYVEPYDDTPVYAPAPVYVPQPQYYRPAPVYRQPQVYNPPVYQQGYQPGYQPGYRPGRPAYQPQVYSRQPVQSVPQRRYGQQQIGVPGVYYPGGVAPRQEPGRDGK